MICILLGCNSVQKKKVLAQKEKPAIEIERCAVHQNFLTALGIKQTTAYAGQEFAALY